MRIESIYFRHHKILGTTDINLYYNADIDRSKKEQIQNNNTYLVYLSSAMNYFEDAF